MAKVYDPLYFDDEGGPINPFRCVDKHYTHEVRWDKSMAMKFNDWIDWEWRPWVEEEYAHTAASITPEMREVYS